MQVHQPISLSPSTFSKMLRLFAPTMRFKSEEDDEFMKQHKGWNIPLSNYLEDPTCNPGTSRIKVSSLKYLYKEFSWLFSHIIGLESTMFVTRNVIYVMHYVLHGKAIIGVISSQVKFCFQLNNLKRLTSSA
jgi:hypothetical protein